MAALTIRNLDDGVKTRLRVRAAQNGRSMEEEARAILRRALAADAGEGEPNLAAFAQALFAPLGGVELPEAPRGPAREPPAFDDASG